MTTTSHPKFRARQAGRDGEVHTAELGIRSPGISGLRDSHSIAVSKATFEVLTDLSKDIRNLIPDRAAS